MLKKTFLLLIFLAALAAAQPLFAQQKTGSWTVYPHIANTYTNVIETDSKLYMLSGGTLMHLSFDDNEFYVYTAEKMTANGGISNIYYNADDKYLLAAYTDGNIDLVYDNGKVVNMPEIRDAVLSTSHTINHVSFFDGKIYVATAFGLVIYDGKRHEVIESGIYNIDLSHVFVIDGNVMVRESKSRALFFAPVEGKHNEYSKFTQIGNMYSDAAYANDLAILPSGEILYVQDGKVWRRMMNFEGKWGKNTEVLGIAAPLTQTATGATGVVDGKLYIIDDEGIETTALPAEAMGAFTYLGSNKSIWVENGSGLTQYDLSGETPTQQLSVLLPEGFNAEEPSQMVWSADGNRLYVTSVSATYIYQNVGDNYDWPSFVDKVENGTISDVAVRNASQYASTYPDFLYDKATDRLGGTLRMVEDPDDPETYYIASNAAGGVVVKDNKIVTIFNKSNSLVPTTSEDGSSWWLTRVLDVNIDNDGNLWMGVGYTKQTYGILTADKRKGDLTKISKSDWITVPGFFQDETTLNRDCKSLFLKKHPNYAIFVLGGSEYGFVVYNNNGTPLNFKDDKYVQHTSWTDTEGNPLTPYHIQSVTEDADGRIWFGTSSGLFIMENPVDAFTADFRVKRPIVPRNDGTIYGDYLLDGESIYAIDCDPSNRKWLGTGSSGAYLVNADGTKILAHYTPDNSSLPSNIVESVACDQHSNHVYFGTPKGVARFDSDSSPAADDYSDVYAYPNPVRPEYTGWITITGLMDNSLVKIADTAGNVFFQGTSEGGMISWDGCGPDGKRVRTGVYLVFASQNATGSASGVVTKIMVVN